MKKLNINDFTKMIPPKGSIGGSVAKSMMNTDAATKVTASTTTTAITPNEAFNGPVLEAGGSIVNNAASDTISGTNPKALSSGSVKGVQPEDVITGILVVGVFVLAGWAAYKIINANNSNNSKNDN